MNSPHLYPLGQGDHAPNAAYLDAALERAKAELRAEMAERIGTLTDFVTWQMRDVDAIVEILRAEHRRRVGLPSSVDSPTRRLGAHVASESPEVR